MSAVATRINLLDLDEAGLQAFFISIGEQPWRAQQVLKWVYHQQVTDFWQMSNLGLELRQRLCEIAEINDHPWMVGVQFHPEFKSKPTAPHPLFREFVRAAIAKKGEV